MRPLRDRWLLVGSVVVPLAACQVAAACDLQAGEPAPSPTSAPAEPEPEPETAAAAAAAASTADLEAAADGWAASYRFSGGRAEREALDAAIEEVVAEMNVLARPIARDRLKASNPIPASIAITREGQTLAIAFDDRRYEAPLDGSRTKVVGITGDTLSYRVVVSETRLEQVFAGDDGGRHNSMRKRGDVGMSLHVKVTSGRLPKPLEYRLTFRRD